ncbi:hypothetical protein EB796_001827 [Bugula neritina]|uniref:Uncharacterized protein n=1 Tax=Bugula neritina TaxID=10212 RepID=A0A7J7KNX0_BUGNE|nr:hypothetical protein EB796_001827 [Bugula neritina]
MHSNSVATLSVNMLTCVTFFRQEAYKFDVYATKSYPQPCLKYACCNGYTSLKGVCYGMVNLFQILTQMMHGQNIIATNGQQYKLPSVFKALLKYNGHYVNNINNWNVTFSYHIPLVIAATL